MILISFFLPCECLYVCLCVCMTWECVIFLTYCVSYEAGGCVCVSVCAGQFYNLTIWPDIKTIIWDTLSWCVCVYARVCVSIMYACLCVCMTWGVIFLTCRILYEAGGLCVCVCLRWSVLQFDHMVRYQNDNPVRYQT